MGSRPPTPTPAWLRAWNLISANRISFVRVQMYSSYHADTRRVARRSSTVFDSSCSNSVRSICCGFSFDKSRTNRTVGAWPLARGVPGCEPEIVRRNRAHDLPWNIIYGRYATVNATRVQCDVPQSWRQRPSVDCWHFNRRTSNLHIVNMAKFASTAV